MTTGNNLNFEAHDNCKQEDTMKTLPQRKWTWIGHRLRKYPSDVAILGKVCFGHQEKRQRGRSAEKQPSPYTCSLPPSPPWMSRKAARETNIPHEIRKAALDRSRWRDYEGHMRPMALQGPIRWWCLLYLSHFWGFLLCDNFAYHICYFLYFLSC